jgi:hypothetical protein
MFEAHPLHRRAYADYSIDWSAYLSDLMGEEEDAPWEKAALLFKWGKEGGEEDDGWKKGEVASDSGHHKRSNITDLAKRDLDYGLALYCVECGFGGSARIWGEISAGTTWDFPFYEVDKVQAGFDATFKAGLYLGMEAFVKYEKEWEKELAKIPIGGFDIADFVEVGPFISVGVEARVGIEASGTLLIGAGVEWDNIDIMLDLLDSGNSHANGLSPQFVHKAEANGELSMEASLGLPIKLGIGVSIFGDFWEADAAVVDTPSVVLEGSFEVSAEVTDDGEIEYDINGGCYGIAWNVHFENTLQAVVEADSIGSWDIDLIEPQESEPIFEGCIGYVNDGTDDNEEPGLGSGSSGGATGNGMNSDGNGLSGGNHGGGRVISISSVTSSTSAVASSSRIPALLAVVAPSASSASSSSATSSVASSTSATSTRASSSSATSSSASSSTKVSSSTISTRISSSTRPTSSTKASTSSTKASTSSTKASTSSTKASTSSTKASTSSTRATSTAKTTSSTKASTTLKTSSTTKKASTTTKATTTAKPTSTRKSTSTKKATSTRR